MRSITLSVAELASRLRELNRDNMSSVSLSFVSGTVDGGTRYPAFLHLEAKAADGSPWDYGEIDELDF